MRKRRACVRLGKLDGLVWGSFCAPRADLQRNVSVSLKISAVQRGDSKGGLALQFQAARLCRLVSASFGTHSPSSVQLDCFESCPCRTASRAVEGSDQRGALASPTNGNARPLLDAKDNSSTPPPCASAGCLPALASHHLPADLTDGHPACTRTHASAVTILTATRPIRRRPA